MACIPAASQLQAVLSAAARALASSTAAVAAAAGAAACSHFLPRRAPKDTAAALMRELSELDRIHLVLALQRSTSKQQLKQAETHYVDDLVKQVSRPTNQQHAKLTRCERAGGLLGWLLGCLLLCWQSERRDEEAEKRARGCMGMRCSMPLLLLGPAPNHPLLPVACFIYLHHVLCRQQIHNAVIYQRLLQKFAAVSEDPPSWRQLAAVGAASGLPFVVFGVLDNGIMVGARKLN